ncbi:MAG: hypothetical protein KAS32_26555 [Candidatus Peribacteraceae bacterium]|nr:hypothetical protein [Candidatus Peribacteraceae bacterium]
MILKRITTGLLLATLIPLISPVFAASGDILGEDQPLSAVISGPNDIAVGRTLVLDASASVGLGEETVYRWFMNGKTQPISRTVEMVFTPEKAGESVIRLEIQTVKDGEELEIAIEKNITIYERKMVLIASPIVTPEKIKAHSDTAANEGIFLKVIQPESSGSTPLTSEEPLLKLIKEQSQTLNGAETIILWTDGITGLQALMQALEDDTERLQGIANQTIVLLSERSLQTLARTARGPFAVLRPSSILITRKTAMNTIFTTPDIGSAVQELEVKDNQYLIVDASTAGIRPWNLLSSLVNYMLTHGTSSQTVILLLMLPVIAMILAFLKQVIGVTTFGLYTPSVIALSFLVLGWHTGLLFLLFILITGYATRAFMRRWRLLYIPKVAIIITVVSITLLLLLGLGTAFDIVLGGDTVFVLLIMSTLSESFLNVKTEEGLYSAILGIGETILAALLCVFIAQWPWLQSIILAYPELILFTIPADVFLGRWSGLRLVEYVRFREVFKHLQEE